MVVVNMITTIGMTILMVAEMIVAPCISRSVDSQVARAHRVGAQRPQLPSNIHDPRGGWTKPGPTFTVAVRGDLGFGEGPKRESDSRGSLIT